MAEAGRRGRFLADLLLCVAAGVLTFVSFPTAAAPELTFWPLIWVSHVPLLWLLKDKSPKAAFRWGLATGVIINVGGYYWLADLLERFGHLPSPVAWLGLVLHGAYQGLIWAFWAWLVNRIGNTTRIPIQWSAPMVMVAVELLMPRLFPAFMGNSLYLFPPIMQIADLVGIYGVTFLVFRVNATLFLWLRALSEGRQRPVRATLATVLLVGGSLAYGYVRIWEYDARAEAAAKLRVGMAEGDVGIFESETPQRIEDHLLIQQHLSASLEAQGAELIVWAESAYRKAGIPQDAKRLDPAETPLVTDAVADRKRNTPRYDREAPLRGFSVPLLFGGASIAPRPEPRFKDDSRWMAYNSAWLLDGQGNVHGRYDKVYLLMFGEYVPLSRYFPWIYQLIPAAGDLEAGDRVHALEADLWGKGPVRIGVLICYEGILPAFTRQVGPLRPHFIANLTNDDWFGKTAERYLHLALTVPRAIEHRVAVVRSTLTGVSAFIDPVGRIVKETRAHDPEAIHWDVPLLQSATVYQVVGDAFAWGCVALTLGAWLWGRTRRRVGFLRRSGASPAA